MDNHMDGMGMVKRYQDPETGKFISKKKAEELGLTTGLTFNESFGKYCEEEAKLRGGKCTGQDIAKELFSREFMLVEFDEATGKASLKIYAGAQDTAIKDMTSEKLLQEYKDLRENFAPVSAGIEYHKTFLCGSGFDVITNDPRDKHKTEMRDEIRRLCRSVYMDYYRQGLDRLLFILADDLLTYGVAAAEICYNREIDFDEFAQKEVNTINGKQVITWTTRLPKNREWKSFKGIQRLKIIDDAVSRLTPYVNQKSFEIKYWALDEKTEKTVSQEIAEEAGRAKKQEGTLFHPFEIFWLSWNTRGTNLKGESIIKPALEIARLVRRIQKAIGKGFDRWADKKYFFICGSERRPWNKNAQRRFIKYLEMMIQNHWTGVPVPTGFDVKEIGGQVFEGTNILNHLINMICAAMNYPRDFLEQGRTRAGDKAWLAWQVKYGSNQRLFRRDIEHQLFQKHLWCTIGKTYKKPKQNNEPIKTEVYIPKILWKAEGRWQRAEELKTLQGWLNVANPVGPEFKLAIEKRGAELMGFGEIEFPSHKELRKQIKLESKMQEIQMMRIMEGEKKGTLEKRLEKGVSKKKVSTEDGQKKPPPKAGKTRKPKTIKKGMPSKS